MRATVPLLPPALLTLSIWLLHPAPVPAAPLDVVQVGAPAVNCVFDADCTIFVTDTTDHFTIGPTSGDAFLQSRTFPPGEPGTPAEGLYAYVYRLDLRQLAGITALPCIFELSLDFGPVTALDYDGSGNPDQVFVVTAGGLGSVGPASAEQTGGTVTFTFAPPVCAGSYPGGGETSYFFGLASTRAPRHVNAQIRDTLGGTATLDARVPEAPGLAPAPLTVFHRLRIRPEQLRLWKSFRERYGERLRVDWNPVTGTPHRIEGAALELPEPPTDNTIEPLARRFLLTHRELLRIDPEQLGLAKIEHLTPERTDAGTGTWQIFYHQVYRDLPVDGGSARMTIRDGRVTSFGSDFRPGVAPLATEPELSTGAALQRVRELDPRYLRRKPVASRLIVFPEAAGDQVRYHLAWDLTMPEVLEPRDLVDPAAPDRGVRTPTGEPPQPLERIPAQWRYLVDAHTGAVIERQNLMRYEDVSGTVTGPVHPEVPDDPPETRPLPDLTVTVTQGLTTTTDETDATGSYLIPGLAAGAATLESHFEGPHLRVWNNETADPDATHATSVTAPATHDWDWASDDPSPDDVETNAFWHIHWIRSWFLQGTPFDVTPDPDPMEVFVRDGEYCNAGAGSSGISFGGGVPGSCEDFSLCSDIAYHEYTHRIVAKVYDDAGVSLPYADETGAMNEGWADYFGSTTTEDSGHGEGCYGGRDIEPDRRYPDDWVGEVHSDGLIFSGALWDLRTALGTAFVDELAMWGMRDATTGFSEYLGAILGWDDDPAFSPDPAADNDPTNGTPNIDAICHAYWDLHGVFHPDCVGHTDLPVAILTAPSPIDFNLADPAAPSLPIEGTALGSSAAPLQSFVLEYAHDGAPATWLTAGVTLTGGGTTPVNAGALGDLALGGLADGLYLLRLTVTDTAANSASAIAAFYLDHALMTGWPQAMEAHFYGSPAIADLDPAYPGLEVAAAASDGSFHVWHADGTAAPGWPRSVSFSRSAPAVADLDADGTLEVVQSTAYGSVYAWSQDGTSLPGWPVSMTFPGQDYEYSTAALGDLDGDGDLEVVVGSTNAEVHAWHHDGTAVAGWPVSVGDWVQASPTLADLDGDGLPEVIFGSRDGQVHVYRGDGTVLAGWPQAIAGAPQVTCSAAAGDLDGDGDFEVVVGTADFDTVFTSVSGRVHAFHADGTAVTGWPQDLTILVFRPASVDLADLDGDGDLEVVVQSNDDNVQVWNGDGTPVAGWPPTGPGGAFYEFTVSSPAIADLDGDGDQEVTAEASYSTVDGFSRYDVWAFHHDASALAGWPKAVSRYSNASPAVADLDGDGDVEVLVGSDGMFVWDLPGAYGVDSGEWPLYRHDNLRTGRYGPKAGVVLLFDTSGSMSWAPDGTMGVPPDESRIHFAREAAYPFLELLDDYNSGKASFGIATFPAHPASYPYACDAEVVTPMTVITPASKTAALTTTIPGLVTEDNTPLLAGMRRAAGMLGAEPRKVIVLLSDGYHNCPSPVSAGDPEVTDLITDLQGDDVRVFSIGFGKPTDVDHPLLEGLASGTTPAGFVGSQFHDVTTPAFDPATWDPATALQETYKNILVDALDLQTATDPLGTIPGGASRSAEVALNEHDRRVSFFLSWRTVEEDRLGLTVRSSDGVAVPPGAPGVRLHRGETYTILTVDRSFLGQPGKVGPPPWRMEISAAGVPQGEQEPFQYSVILDSALRFRPALDRARYGAGQKILLTARVTEPGAPAADVDGVEVTVTAPDEGLGNWLALHPVSPEELARIPETRGTERLAPFERKALFLTEIRGLSFPKVRPPTTLDLVDDGTHGDREAGDGVYSRLFEATGKPGVYSFHVRARGDTAGGNGFDRDRRLQRFVDVQPTIQHSLIEIVRLASDEAIQRFAIRIVPRDALGNVLGPGRAPMLGLRVSRGKLAGSLADELDGGYRQVLELPAGVDPRDVRVQLDLGGPAGETATFTVADKLVEPSARPSLGLSAHAGWTAPRGGFDNRFDGGLHLGLDLEAPFRARWSAVGTLSYSRFEAAARGLDDQEWLSLTAGLKYAPKPGRPGRLRPYVTGALGLYEPDRGSTEAGYTLGVGLDYELDPDWALELGADYHDLFTDRPDLEFLALRLGIVYRLGGP